MICKHQVCSYPVYRFTYEPIHSNMYLILGQGEALVIDPCISREAFSLLEQSNVRSVTVLLTHEHYDHISGVNALRERYPCHVVGSLQAAERVSDSRKNLAAYVRCLVPDKYMQGDWLSKFGINEQYACEVDEAFESDCIMQWQEIPLRLTVAPGHSPGSICIFAGEGSVFTGDSLVDGNDIILRLPGSSRKEYYSITKPLLEDLHPDTIVFPGHGEEGRVTGFHIV